MSSLLDMPNELLCEILSYLEFDRQLLLSLSLLNFRLHVVVQPYLFRYADKLSKRQLDLFTTSIARRRHLWPAVRSYGPLMVGPLGYAAPNTLFLIRNFTNLKKIQLRFCTWPSMSSTSTVGYITNIFVHGTLDQVEDVHVTWTGYLESGFSELLRKGIMMLPRIKSLTVEGNWGLRSRYLGPGIQQETWIHSSLLPPRTDCNLTTLRIPGLTPSSTNYGFLYPSGGIDRIYGTDFYTLLSKCRSLQNLQCTNLFISHGRQQLTSPVHGNWVRHALLTVSNTLQSLTLTTPNHERECDCMLDFSSKFPSLRDLEISSVYMIRSQGAAERATLFRYLPPNLESLKVRLRLLDSLEPELALYAKLLRTCPYRLASHRP
jgi:hypothetical protein